MAVGGGDPIGSFDEGGTIRGVCSPPGAGNPCFGFHPKAIVDFGKEEVKSLMDV